MCLCARSGLVCVQWFLFVCDGLVLRVVGWFVCSVFVCGGLVCAVSLFVCSGFVCVAGLLV